MLLFCSLVSLFTGSGCQKRERYDLRYIFKDGESFSYNIVTDQSTEIQNQDDINFYQSSSRFILRYTTDSVSDGNTAWFSFSYDSIKVAGDADADPIQKNLKNINSMRGGLKITDKGEIIGASGLDELMGTDEMSDFNVTKMLVKLLPVFPGEPIALNREWSREQKFPVENKLIKGNMLVYKHYKLEKAVLENQGKLLHISSVIKMKLELPQSGEKRFSVKKGENIDVGLIGTGSIIYDTARHIITAAKADFSGQMIFELNDPFDEKSILSRISIKQQLELKLR
ncbi:MAG: hypothetical protein ABIA63_13065 [bacterium]